MTTPLVVAKFPVVAAIHVADFDAILNKVNQADSSGGAVVCRLPAAAGINGQFVAVSAIGGAVTLAPNGTDTIASADPGAPLGVTTSYTTMVVSDGVSNWLVFSL